MTLAELLQKYLGHTTPMDSKPTYASLLIPPEEVCKHFTEAKSTIDDAQELLDRKAVTTHYITDPTQVADVVKGLRGAGVNA